MKKETKKVKLFTIVLMLMDIFFLYCFLDTFDDWEPLSGHVKLVLHGSGVFMSTYLLMNIKYIL